MIGRHKPSKIESQAWGILNLEEPIGKFMLVPVGRVLSWRVPSQTGASLVGQDLTIDHSLRWGKSRGPPNQEVPTGESSMLCEGKDFKGSKPRGPKKGTLNNLCRPHHYFYFALIGQRWFFDLLDLLAF